jgi:hypothetical protein
VLKEGIGAWFFLYYYLAGYELEELKLSGAWSVVIWDWESVEGLEESGVRLHQRLLND